MATEKAPARSLSRSCCAYFFDDYVDNSIHEEKPEASFRWQNSPISARWFMRTREHGSHRHHRCHFSPDWSRHAPDALQRGFSPELMLRVDDLCRFYA